MTAVSQSFGRLRQPKQLIRLEGAVLLAGGFFLLFPERWPAATMLALLALAAVWLLPLVALRDTLLRLTPFHVALLLWGLVVAVGVLVSADPAATLPKATGVILGLAVWRYLALAPHTRRQLCLAFAVFLLLASAFAVVGVFGLQEFPKIPALALLTPSHFIAIPGLGAAEVHPNQLAGLISLYLPLLVSLLLAWRSPVYPRAFRLVLLVATTVTALILVLTQSRGGWIGAVAGLATLALLWVLILPSSPRRRLLRLGLLVFAGLLVAVVIRVGPAQLQALWLDPPEETVIGTFQTLNYRKELWPWALTAAGDFAFTGVGLGAFREVVFRLYPVELSAAQDIGHAHNIFLQTALDVGLPGLVVYLALLLTAAAVGWRVARLSDNWRPFALGLLAGLAALHVYGLADALALGSKPALLFWYALGLLTAMNRRRSDGKVNAEAGRQ